MLAEAFPSLFSPIQLYNPLSTELTDTKRRKFSVDSAVGGSGFSSLAQECKTMGAELGQAGAKVV